ncbi:hypothetical protein BDD12DRAFT_852532 [Trichophaea hybrida]|nr:hypothetical protein BDD12DRAFT_852532 [Trichophaea hybrida]
MSIIVGMTSKVESRSTRFSNNNGSSSTTRWTPLASTPDSLLEQLTSMYWAGVHREICGILLTLHQWQSPKYASIYLEEEKNHELNGFDTFIDQVNESARSSADRAAALRQQLEQAQLDRTQQICYEDLLEWRAINSIAMAHTTEMKREVRRNLPDSAQVLSIVERRAKLLLQSAAFLDIDKIVEYRPPLLNFGFWKRPRVPQLKLRNFEDSGMPRLTPERCSMCKDVIRGIMFTCTDSSCLAEKSGSCGNVCEACFRENRHRKTTLKKTFKHCILPEVITATTARRICECLDVPRFDADGKPQSLFPVAKDDLHHCSYANGQKCGLLALEDAIIEGKRDGQLLGLERRGKDPKIDKQRSSTGYRERFKKTWKGPHAQSAKAVDTEEEDMPFWLKNILLRYPFGNVHMALMIGPLIIENGVAGGALITSRDPLHLQVPFTTYDVKQLEYSLSLGNNRKLYSQHRTNRQPRRIKTCMKQIVGGAFAGYFDRQLEYEIIRDLVTESQVCNINPRKELEHGENKIMSAATRIVTKIRQLLEGKVQFYLSSITHRLFDPQTKLQWKRRSNNCQNFCNALLDWPTFGSLFPPPQLEQVDQHAAPLYLLSFVTRPGSYCREKVRTKFDVPNGLTEEYLLKFRFGQHDDADIADTLDEYWYDWGAFGSHLYKHQHLFPWDCTKAYDPVSSLCNDCTISKHVWSFPFDSWNILLLHLQKGREFYAPSDDIYSNSTQLRMSDQAWMRNRLLLLVAQDALLSVAVAMSKSQNFRNSSNWLHSEFDERKDRLKLGGIHRAQPYSEQYSEGSRRYCEYYTADWAHIRHQEQVAAYEAQREAKRRARDVGRSVDSNSERNYIELDLFVIGWLGDWVLADDTTPATDDTQQGYCTDGWDGTVYHDGCVGDHVGGEGCDGGNSDGSGAGTGGYDGNGGWGEWGDGGPLAPTPTAAPNPGLHSHTGDFGTGDCGGGCGGV